MVHFIRFESQFRLYIIHQNWHYLYIIGICIYKLCYAAGFHNFIQEIYFATFLKVRTPNTTLINLLEFIIYFFSNSPVIFEIIYFIMIYSSFYHHIRQYDYHYHYPTHYHALFFFLSFDTIRSQLILQISVFLFLQHISDSKFHFEHYQYYSLCL